VEPGLTVQGDARMMRSVLENLVGNAWKFTARREDACIEVGAARGEYFVRDNGAGFDMAYADRLFGTFQRLHDAAEFPGTGIGLATVARAMSRLGGRVRAEAEPGRGATFYFSLPAA
jgi:light-regulated signal transduction histidine kinase (bacteriophytochrome)